MTGFILLGFAGAVAACEPGGNDTANGGIGGTSWTVVSIDGAPTIADARPTMVFEFDGRLSGSSGCNQYSGTFHTDDDRITIGPLMSTMMGCDAARTTQEQAFTAALAATTDWHLSEQGSLELSGSHRIVAEPAVITEEPG